MPWFYCKSFAKFPGAPPASALGHNLLETLTLREHVHVRAWIESQRVGCRLWENPGKKALSTPSANGGFTLTARFHPLC